MTSGFEDKVIHYPIRSWKECEPKEAGVFLESRLKSSNPMTRKKAVAEMAAKARKQALRGRGEWSSDPARAADTPLLEFARTEKDAAVLEYALSQVGSGVLLPVAKDENESGFLRAAALRAYAARVQSNARSALERGDGKSARELLDVVTGECASILATCPSDEVRAAALEVLAGPEPEDLATLLSEPIDAGKLFMHLLGERDPNRVSCIVDKLKSMEAPKDFSYVEGPFSIVMRNRESYPDYLVEQLTDVYAHWTGMSPRQVRLKFASRGDLDRLKESLYGDNVNQSIFALEDLQEMYRLGVFRSEIAAMTYSGQSVATYRDRNAGNIITAPTH